MNDNMSDFVDDVLYDNKKKKKKSLLKETEIDIKKILEADEDKNIDDEEKDDEEKDDEERDDEEEDEDILLEVIFRVNNEEQTVQLQEKQYGNRALTDFISLISLFKSSTKIDIHGFLDSLGLGVQPKAGVEKEIDNQGGVKLPGEEETKEEEEFKLNSFKLVAEEKVSQTGNSRVAITGEENINNMLSFKVSIDEESTPFNVPESAISHFNNIFFTNIIKIIDKELEKRNSE